MRGGLSSDLLKQSLEGGIFAAGIERLDEVQQVVAPDGVRLTFQVQRADAHAGRDVELQIDYAELEAMRCGCSPAEVFRGPVLQWSPHAEAWLRREVDGEVNWEHPRFGVRLPAVEIRVWLSEAAERGYWDGELRVAALCGWHRIDRRVARELDKVKESLVELFTDARGGRSGYDEKKKRSREKSTSHREKRTPFGERLIGWLTGQDEEPAGAGEANEPDEWRPYAPPAVPPVAPPMHGDRPPWPSTRHHIRDAAADVVRESKMSVDAQLVLTEARAIAKKGPRKQREVLDHLRRMVGALMEVDGTGHGSSAAAVDYRLREALDEIRQGPTHLSTGEAEVTGDPLFDTVFWRECAAQHL